MEAIADDFKSVKVGDLIVHIDGETYRVVKHNDDGSMLLVNTKPLTDEEAFLDRIYTIPARRML